LIQLILAEYSCNVFLQWHSAKMHMSWHMALVNKRLKFYELCVYIIVTFSLPCFSHLDLLPKYLAIFLTCFCLHNTLFFYILIPHTTSVTFCIKPSTLLVYFSQAQWKTPFTYVSPNPPYFTNTCFHSIYSFLSFLE
jgi:hypothetical protein